MTHMDRLYNKEPIIEYFYKVCTADMQWSQTGNDACIYATAQIISI
jgi:hypothetical protein